MTLPLRVRRRAALDLDEPHAWYAQSFEGLGDDLLPAVRERWSRVAAHSGAFSLSAIAFVALVCSAFRT